MTLSLRGLTIAAMVTAALVGAPAAFAQDAAKPAPVASDAMAADPMAPDAMAAGAMMSDDDLKLCLEQAAMITFPQVMDAATAACHGMHNGMMADPMAPDAMAPDAMAPDAMAPAN